jgi:prepilin-type N-terminal cleavage/methylation domain-containing protein
MTHRRDSADRRRSAFTLIELLIVLTIAGIVTGMAIPKINISSYRSDAAAQQVRSVFTTAQRTSLTRQYDVIVSVDTVKGGLRIAEDRNNNGLIEPALGETKFWRPPGEGNRFSVPPFSLANNAIKSSVIGSNLKLVDNMPSILFHRDGSASTDAEIYVSSAYKNRIDYRAITLIRSTGRADAYRLAVAQGASKKWEVIQ